MKAVYLVIGLFAASAWGYEAEQYRKIEATYLNKIRDTETGQAVDDQNFKRTIYSAVFNDEGVIFTFNITKAFLTDNLPFAEVSVDLFTIQAEEKTTTHNQSFRFFQMKSGHMVERQVGSVFVNQVDENGRVKSTFPGGNKEAFALFVSQTNADGSGVSQKVYYNMNQVQEDSIVDSSSITMAWTAMDAKAFLATLPLNTRKFLLRFAEAHRNAVKLHGERRRCENETPQYCDEIHGQLETISKLRDRIWASFSGDEAYGLRPVPPVLIRPRPMQQQPGFFGGRWDQR
jgi:hypothetical protein